MRMLGMVANHKGNCGYGCCPVFNPNAKRERKQSRRTERRREKQSWKREVSN